MNCSACIATGILRPATQPLAVTTLPYALPGLTVQLCDDHNATIPTTRKA